MNEAGGFFYVFVCIIGFVIGIVWVIFPFIVISKFDRLLGETKEISDLIDRIRSSHNETTKALQWFVNNWRER